jgi:hypothetical protein
MSGIADVAANPEPLLNRGRLVDYESCEEEDQRTLSEIMIKAVPLPPISLAEVSSVSDVIQRAYGLGRERREALLPCLR